MGKTWKTDDWHDEEEIREAEYRKSKRKKREFIEPDVEEDPHKPRGEIFSLKAKFR